MAERERNEVWDAIVELFDLTPESKTECRRIGKVVQDLRAKGATAGEIRLRAKRYKAAWPDMTLTPESLEKHWSHFSVDRTTRRPGRVLPEEGKYDGL